MSKTNEYRKITVEGIAMYACVHTPKKPFVQGNPLEYTVDLVVDEHTAKRLSEEGLKPAKIMVTEDSKKLKEYSQYPGLKVFTLRRKTQKRDGTAMTPLSVVDSDLNVIPSSVLIGNGSRIKASINPYKFDLNGKSMSGHVLLGIQVLDLVEFKSTKESGFEKTKGFVLSKTATQSTEEDSNECPFG